MTRRLAAVLAALLLVVGCSSDTRTDSASPQPLPTAAKAYQSDEPATTRATTTAARPGYCADYDTWTATDAEMDALEARHGPDTSTWPAGDVDAMFAAMDRRAAAVQRVWARAPESATVSSVQSDCTG